MVGIALTSLFTVVLATAREQAARELAENFPIDFQLDAVSHGGGDDNLPAALDRDLRSSGAFSVVARSRLDYVWTPDGEQLAVAALQPATADTRAPLPVEVVRGTLASLGPGTIAVRARYAYAHDISVGADLALATYGGGSIPARVVAIYDDAPVQGDLLMGWSQFARYLGPRGDQVLLRRAPDTGATAARQALDRVLTAYPLVSVTSQADRREQLTLGLQQRLAQFGALLALSTVIAILGIMDTLALSVLERSGESALLRALGLSRRQLRVTLVGEAVLMALVGAVLGVAFGVGVGWLTAQSLIQAYGHGTPSIPVVALLGYVALAAAAGALASLLPARSFRVAGAPY
jgi:putative ABC transport system permease protein